MSDMAHVVGSHRHPHLIRADAYNAAAKRPMLTEDNCIEIGYYVHRSKLGEGGFGKVMLATHIKTGHKVAIKMMNKVKLGVSSMLFDWILTGVTSAKPKADLFRVRTEISSLKVLRHDNIAKLLQVIETETDIYLVMEYCSGGELFDYLVSKSRLSENETKLIIRDLAKVLAFIHHKGFAHRDLKPENILFDGNHKIKLIDFGLAASGSTCCGSPAYAAPELLSGPNYSGPAVDVWSAGVLLYALLVGQLPFDDEKLPVLYKKIADGKFHIPSFLSVPVRDLIRSMLTTNPQQRITVEQILRHPWINLSMDKVETSVQILEESFNEWAFYECTRIFPNTPIRQLRHNIMHGFGYQTATYCLIAMNNSSFKKSINPIVLKSSPIRPNRRRSKSMSENTNNENVLPSETYNLLIVKSRGVDSPGAVKAFASPEIKSKIPVASTNTKDAQKLRQFQSPKNGPSPMKKPRFPDDTDLGRTTSPLRAKQVLSPKTPVNQKFECTPKTPTNQKIECTPKKSLFKRILETATPSKSHNPREVTTSSSSKNITLTNFSDPQKCIHKLVNSLSMKGIQCTQKDFTLRCVLSTNNIIILSFNLEICKFGEKCVIQRKRLKGDAWNYKKVCEEILRISNE